MRFIIFYYSWFFQKVEIDNKITVAPYRTEYMRIIAKQMIQPLCFLHGNGFIHGDVKSKNYMFANEPDTKYLRLTVNIQLRVVYV